MTTPDLLPLPDYIYGRECGDNERVYTEAQMRAYALANLQAAKPTEECQHHKAVTQHTGDGIEVQFCPDCGRNFEVGGVPIKPTETSQVSLPVVAWVHGEHGTFVPQPHDGYCCDTRYYKPLTDHATAMAEIERLQNAISQARAEAFEEAAKVCEEQVGAEEENPEWGSWGEFDHAAAAIRSKIKG